MISDLIEIFRFFLEILFGFAAGSVTASGLFALITSVGLINRFALVTKTTQKLLLYETMIVSGAVLGNVVSVFNFRLSLNNSIAFFISLIYGLVAGIFIGTFSVCLAETLKALPIFVRRVRIGAGLGFIILSVALGKCVGHLIYYLILY